MFGDFNKDVDRNRSILALLIEMANADDEQASIEDKYISYVASQLAISDEELALIKSKPEQLPFVPPAGEHDRMTILYYLLFTMRVDTVIKEKEEGVAHRIGLRLGINPALTQDLIHVMKRYNNKDIPENALLDQIKKYLN